MVQLGAVSLPEPDPSRTALVTGAAGGIGGAIARELAARGHGLVLVDLRKDRLTAFAGELAEEHEVRVDTIACDLADAPSRSRLAEQIAGMGLAVEILVNNAGFATGGPFHLSDPARELAEVRVLVETVVVLTSAFSPGMVERSRGAILNVSSTAAFQPMPYSAGYGAAKAYVLSFSEALHQELRGHGITVTALCPGPVDTGFWQIADWKVAGGRSFEHAIPGALISAEDAARAGVRGLESGKRVVVPGLRIRAAMDAARYIPHAVKLPALEWFMRDR